MNFDLSLQLRDLMAQVRFWDIIDIIIVAFVLYKIFVLIRGTRAVQLLKGLAVLLVATTVSNWLGLYTINWLLQKTLTMVFVALPIVFQPELRRALEQLGRGRFFGKNTIFFEEEDMGQVINEVVRAVQILARNKVGALIVIERETGLKDYIETGIRIEALVSAELLVNTFIPNTPLHDGAAILRRDRVMASSCLLPLADDATLSKELGTRHRAAIGVSEQSDAIAVVISEETGIVSLAVDGQLVRFLDEKTLRERLVELLQPGVQGHRFLFNRRWM